MEKKLIIFQAPYKIRLKVKPIYKRFDGWLENTQGVKKWKNLPKKCTKVY